jgi:hypothetical protein
LSTKAKGTKNEYKSMRYLEAMGYRCTRSAASLGEWDIIGIGTDDVVLVQVKSNRWPGRPEMEILKAFSVPSGVRKLVYRWDDYARKPKERLL